MTCTANDPEVIAAQQAEQTTRDLAFLDIPFELCGELVRQVTPRTVLYLTGAGSPFMVGGMPLPEHVAQFLWVHSVDYRKGNGAVAGWLRWRLCRRIRGLDYMDSVQAVRQYVDDAFMDAPNGKGGEDSPFASSMAHFVDAFASEYGWDANTVLDAPIAVLFQLRRLHVKRADPNKHFMNRSDDVIAMKLKERNSRGVL